MLGTSESEHDPRIAPLIDLARWGLALPREQHVELAESPMSQAPRWSDACLPAAAAAAPREAFDRGERVAFSVPVWVKPATGLATRAAFDVYLEPDDTVPAGDEHFVRDGITITGVHGALQKGVRSLVVVRDPALCELLGDSENPAHTEWQERSAKFKSRYRHGPFTLRYVKNAPREIARILTRPPEGRDERFTRHLFALDLSTEQALLEQARPRRMPAGGDTADDGGIGTDTGGKDPFARLQKLPGGFRLLGSGVPASMPPRAEVRIAYEVRRGNPFTQYQPPDFELDKPPIEVHAERAAVFRRQYNVLAFRIEAPDFLVTVSGFDVLRDMRVQVLGLEGPGA